MMYAFTETQSEVRAVSRGAGVRGSVVDCPVVFARQLHPLLHVMFVPDDPAERIETWPRVEFTKYFEIIKGEFHV